MKKILLLTVPLLWIAAPIHAKAKATNPAVEGLRK